MMLSLDTSNKENTSDKLEKRSERILNVLKKEAKKNGNVDLHQLTSKNTKRQAASLFSILLELGKQRKLNLMQETPTSTIIITGL